MEWKNKKAWNKSLIIKYRGKGTLPKEIHDVTDINKEEFAWKQNCNG